MEEELGNHHLADNNTTFLPTIFIDREGIIRIVDDGDSESEDLVDELNKFDSSKFPFCPHFLTSFIYQHC